MNTRSKLFQPRNRILKVRLIGLATGAVVTALSLAVISGCQNHDGPAYEGQKEVGGDMFAPEGQTRSVERFSDTQAAAAARTDATLRPYHFDGTELNSLGQQKLDLMSKDDRAFAPLFVYLDLPHDVDQDTRREAVLVFLKDHGLKDDQIRIQFGPNLSPDNVHPVVQSMRTLHQLDAGAPIGTNPEPGGSAGAPAVGVVH